MGLEIWDCHIHLTPPEIIERASEYRARDKHFKTLGESDVNRYATAEDLITEMDRSGVDRAVVGSFAFRDQGLCRLVNDYIIQVVQKYPRLLGLASVSPLEPGLEKEIDRCQRAGLAGVGELFPDGQGFDITHPDQVQELANICIERSLPLLIHVNEQVGHFYPGKGKTGPEEAYKFAADNPDLVVILAHLGGGLLFYEAMPEVRDTLKNVYYDTAAVPFLYEPGIYRVLQTADLSHKVILGSDYPIISPSRNIEDLEGLPVEDREKILAGNARRVFCPE